MAKPVGFVMRGLKMFRNFSMTPFVTKFTDGVAFLAIFAWMDPSIVAWVQNISELAALATPIFAVLWLITQIAIKIASFLRNKEDDKDEE